MVSKKTSFFRTNATFFPLNGNKSTGGAGTLDTTSRKHAKQEKKRRKIKKETTEEAQRKREPVFLLPRFYGKKKGIEILKTRALDAFNVNKQFNSVISWVLVWK